MGRNNTKAVKSINRMYEQMNLDTSEILHKTKLLLSVYRDVVWATLHEANEVHEDIYYFGHDLNAALVYLEEFAPDTEKAEFEAKVSSMFENKWMIDLIDKAMTRVYDYHNNGRLYHEILSKCYLTAFRYTESEVLELLCLERSTFYDRIGEHRLRQLVRENRQADFVLWIGTKVEIKRELFEKFLDEINAL